MSLSSRRRRIGVLAAAGTLTVAAAAAAAAVPSPGQPAARAVTDADIVASPPGVLSFMQVRSGVLHHVSQSQAAAKPSSSSANVAVAPRSPEQVARSMVSQFGWSGSQYSCLYPLWRQESNWSITAANASSGAYGIPQALPGSRMASAGPDWRTSAATQIRWGLEYIKSTYGSPCAAWSHEQADGWY